MIANLKDYFEPSQEIFLDSISYNKIENTEVYPEKDIFLICQDNVRASIEASGVKILLTRSLTFDPNVLFHLSVTFGTLLKFNKKKNDIDWEKLDLAEEFRENGEFATSQLMNRISLLIGQITSSFGQQPIMLPTSLIKKDPLN